MQPVPSWIPAPRGANVPRPSKRLRRLAARALPAAWVVFASAYLGLALLSAWATYLRFSQRVCGYADQAGPCTHVNAFLQSLGLEPQLFGALNAMSVLLAALPWLGVATLLFLNARGRRTRLLFAFLMAAVWMSDITNISVNGTIGWLVYVFSRNVNWAIRIGLGAAYGLAGSLAVVMAFTFPNGRWMPRWLRWVGWGWCVIVLLKTVAGNTPDGPTVFDYSLWPVVGNLPTIVMPVLVLFSLVYRYRRTGPQQRDQMRWVMPATMLLVGVYLVGTVLDQLMRLPGGVHEDTLPHFFLWVSQNVIQSGCAALVALAIGAAMLQRRLFGLTVVQRGLFYAALTALALALYIFLLGGLSLAAAAVLGASLANSPAWLSLVAVGLVAFLLQPLRSPLDRAIQALVYGTHRQMLGDEALRLARSLSLAPEPETVGQTLVNGLWQALPLAYAALALVDNQGVETIVFARGKLDAGALVLPLTTQGQRVGALRVAPARQLAPHERRWLTELALHASVAVYAARATLALRHAQAELRTSIADERARIQRELHDGLGPSLASLVLSLDSLRTRAETQRVSVAQAVAELEGIKADARDIIAQIQGLVAQLRPPVLDQLGLAEAVRYFAASCLGTTQVQVDAPAALPPLPAAVEHAAYRIVCEAITNTLRHAKAAHCRVTLAATPPTLRVAVADDGVGAPAPGQATGLGLASMRARAEELGGSFGLTSSPGAGTLIQVLLPLAHAVGTAYEP